jgi:hypothetical protein
LHVAASILASLLTLKESNWSRFPVTSPATGCIAARIIERDHQEGTVKTPDTP